MNVREEKLFSQAWDKALIHSFHGESHQFCVMSGAEKHTAVGLEANLITVLWHGHQERLRDRQMALNWSQELLNLKYDEQIISSTVWSLNRSKNVLMKTKAIAIALCFYDYQQYFFSCFSLEFICLTGEKRDFIFAWIFVL